MINFTRRTVLEGMGAVGIAAIAPRAYATGDYPQRVLGKHPVGYWRLNEMAGPVAHDAANSHHDGAYHGGVAFGQRGPGRGLRGSAIGLNGMDAFVEVANSDAFSQGTSGRGLSVEAWVRPDRLEFGGQTDENYVHWLGKGQSGEFEWGFRFYSRHSSRPNRISAYIWNPTSAPGVRNEGAGAYFQDDVQPGAWLHVVACFDPGDASDARSGVSIYKDGVLRHGPASSRGARYSSYQIVPRRGLAPVRLGTRDQGSFLAGGLAEVAIYPRVLTAGEVLDNFASA